MMGPVIDFSFKNQLLLTLYQTTNFCFNRVENFVRKRRNCWLPAFSPFPTMFSRGVFLRGVISRQCGKGLMTLTVSLRILCYSGLSTFLPLSFHNTFDCFKEIFRNIRNFFFLFPPCFQKLFI